MPRKRRREHSTAAHDLAVTFVADTAGPWQQAFEAWADERELSLELRRLTRVAIIRTRCFGGRS